MYYEITHPLVKHKLTVLRNAATEHKQFRELAGELTILIGYEAMKNLEINTINVNTPLAGTIGCKIKHDIVVIPILRTGVGMLEGMLKLIPNARVGFLELYKDPDTQKLVSYYERLPHDLKDPYFFIIDPMLATGGSIIAAIEELKERDFSHIAVISLISAPEGIKRIVEAHPEIDIYTGSIDECLDANNNIIPGLGNAHDRLFGIT